MLAKRRTVAVIVLLAVVAATVLGGCEKQGPGLVRPAAQPRQAPTDGRNEPPDTEITHGPAGVTGPMVGFEWQGSDPDGEVVGYGWRLYLGSMGEWYEVAGIDSVGADVTSVLFGPLAGLHRFEVWSIDDAGALDPTPAVRTFTCNPALAGPRLTIRTNVLGTHVLRGPVWPESYNTPIPIFEGEHLTFHWSASADDYGGRVVGYRSAYDDTSNWPAWSLTDTAFVVTPEAGEHSLYITALDNANVVTRSRIAFDVIETSLDEYILVVDDHDHLESMPQWGTDAMRDAFYDTLLADYVRPVVQWDPTEHTVQGDPKPPDVATLAGASTVIWYVDREHPELEQLFNPYLTPYNQLSGYARVGGNLVLCGLQAIGQIMDQTYPIYLTSWATSERAEFVRDVLRVRHVDSTGEGADPDAPWDYGYCFYGAVPSGMGVLVPAESDFSPMYIDSLGKWAGVYGGTVPGLERAGMPLVETVRADWTEAGEPFLIKAFLNPRFSGDPCAVLTLSGSDRGNVCYFGFPLYYLQTPQVLAVFDRLLPLFGEEKR